jgi:hypothetical protein
MTTPHPDTRAILRLLKAQRSALLAGELAALAGMEAQLDRGLRRLAAARVPHEELARIRDGAARNARLLEAARAGLRTARGRIADRAGARLATYDAAGQRQTGGPAGTVLSRR